MIDITYCVNDECPIRDDCERSVLPENEHCYVSNFICDEENKDCLYLIPRRMTKIEEINEDYPFKIPYEVFMKKSSLEIKEKDKEIDNLKKTVKKLTTLSRAEKLEVKKDTMWQTKNGTIKELEKTVHSLRKQNDLLMSRIIKLQQNG